MKIIKLAQSDQEEVQGDPVRSEGDSVIYEVGRLQGIQSNFTPLARPGYGE